MRAFVYLAWLGGTVAALAIAVIAFTIAIDPYRMFGTRTVQGWTELKPRAAEQMGIAKTYQLERIAPTTLLLGNSRTEIGLDPTSAAFPVGQTPVFNAAYAGGDICTSLLMLRDTLAVRRPEKVVLGIDFQDLLTVPKAPSQPNSAERRLLVDQSGHPNPWRKSQIWNDRLASTLTIDAVADSVLTLFNQDPGTSATMTPLGFNPLREYRTFVSRNGYHGIFAAKSAAYRKQYAQYPKPDFAHPSFIMTHRNGCFTSIMRLAMEHHIALMLYIHPYHADYLEMVYDLGMWPSFEAWKRVLVDAVERITHESPGDIRIFDFSGFDEFTTEVVPPSGDRRSAMRWYWEPGHYKSALGEYILAAILHGDSQFGRLITSMNIESVLADIREQRNRFVSQREAGNKESKTSLDKK